jgi:hypothetical protein
MLQRMPRGYRLTPEALILPDKTQIELGFAAADDQFARVFRTSLRQPATPDELDTVDNYTVNALLSGPGGSLPSAHKMMQAGAAMVQAGGVGVFIDNSALAHGGQGWLAMTEDGGPDAVSFAFVSIIRGDEDVWTMGMHVLGLRDLVMKRADIEAEGFDIVEVIRCLARGEKPIGDGHILADLNGPQFHTCAGHGSTSGPKRNGMRRLSAMNGRAASTPWPSARWPNIRQDKRGCYETPHNRGFLGLLPAASGCGAAVGGCKLCPLTNRSLASLVALQACWPPLVSAY